jgi:hypothetical protein
LQNYFNLPLEKGAYLRTGNICVNWSVFCKSPPPPLPSKLFSEHIPVPGPPLPISSLTILQYGGKFINAWATARVNVELAAKAKKIEGAASAARKVSENKIASLALLSRISFAIVLLRFGVSLRIWRLMLTCAITLPLTSSFSLSPGFPPGQ